METYSDEKTRIFNNCPTTSEKRHDNHNNAQCDQYIGEVVECGGVPSGVSHHLPISLTEELPEPVVGLQPNPQRRQGESDHL